MSTRDDKLAQGRADAAERQRRHRERQKAGYRSVLLDIADSQIGELVRRGLVSEEDRANPYLVGDAVAEFLDCALGGGDA